MKQHVVFGATSAVAMACGRIWAERGDCLLLVARDAARLEEVAADLRVRAGAADRVTTFVLDATDLGRLPELMAACRGLARIDSVLIAHGVLPSQAACEADAGATRMAIEVNGTSAVVLIGAFGELLAPRGTGVVAVIGSVAGDRGRGSNYTYGCAKAMVATYAAGLRHRLAHSGVRVLTIKPGFIDTPMTASFAGHGPLWVGPDRVARDIVEAMDRRNGTLYTPWFWRYVMAVIRLLPERVLWRTRL